MTNKIVESYTDDKFLVLCVTPDAFDSIPYVKNVLTGGVNANSDPAYHKIIPITQITIASVAERLGIHQTSLLLNMNNKTEYFQISKVISTD
jgi:hypothetical protein